MSVLLKLHEVVVRRQQREILHGISLAFEPGTVTALVGPNGAGKSTLLAVAAGDLRADAGEVSLLGKPLASYKAGPLARERAVMPQEHGVRFAFSVEEVVAMGRLPHPPDPRWTMPGGSGHRCRRTAGAAPARRCSSCPVASPPGPRSRACWRRTRRCCCWMSRPPRWICAIRSVRCAVCVPVPRPVRA
jgi:energy-coupling factor transporter ATP-binding protein EcfA2